MNESVNYTLSDIGNFQVTPPPAIFSIRQNVPKLLKIAGSSSHIWYFQNLQSICPPPPLEEFSSTDPFPIDHFYYLENQENEEIKLVLKAFWCPIFMKLSGKLL